MNQVIKKSKADRVQFIVAFRDENTGYLVVYFDSNEQGVTTLETEIFG